MEHEPGSRDAACLIGDHSDAGPPSRRNPELDQAEAGGPKPRRSILERAHKSVGPQSEAAPGAPRSGSA